MVITIPKETHPSENRVACVPDVASKLIKAGYEVQVEKDAGLNAGFRDEQYVKAGAKIVDNVDQLYSNADIVLKVQKPSNSEIQKIKKGSILISFVYVLHYPEVAKMCAERGIDLIAMEMIPETIATISQTILPPYENKLQGTTWSHDCASTSQ